MAKANLATSVIQAGTGEVLNVVLPVLREVLRTNVNIQTHDIGTQKRETLTKIIQL